VDLYRACREHISKALRYGACSQGISQFYLRTSRSSANRMKAELHKFTFTLLHLTTLNLHVWDYITFTTVRECKSQYEQNGRATQNAGEQLRQWDCTTSSRMKRHCNGRAHYKHKPTDRQYCHLNVNIIIIIITMMIIIIINTTDMPSTHTHTHIQTKLASSSPSSEMHH